MKTLNVFFPSSYKANQPYPWDSRAGGAGAEVSLSISMPDGREWRTPFVPASSHPITSGIAANHHTTPQPQPSLCFKHGLFKSRGKITFPNILLYLIVTLCYKAALYSL